jgi:CRISPR-associated Cas5-like protein
MQRRGAQRRRGHRHLWPQGCQRPLASPLQAWGHSSRFQRRTTALHPTKSGVILSGEAGVLTAVAKAVQNPAWGVWLGRKSCIPADVLFRGSPFTSDNEAWRALVRNAPLSQFTRVEEVGRFVCIIAPFRGYLSSVSCHPYCGSITLFIV